MESNYDENRNKTPKKLVTFESLNNDNSKIQNFTIGFKTNDMQSDNIEKTISQTQIYIGRDDENDKKSNYKQIKQTQSEQQIDEEFNEKCFEGSEDQQESGLVTYEYPNEEDVKSSKVIFYFYLDLFEIF